jgi:hypothetical protein
MIFTRNEFSNQITATIPDEGIAQSYDCSIRGCPNPLCQCSEIFVSLKPKPVRGNEYDNSSDAWGLSINISEKSLVEKDVSSAELSFARKVHGLLHEDDYQLLFEEYYAHKLKSTETADLNTLQAEFPMEDIEQNNVMISYADVLPYARHISLTINNNRYIVEDLYCVKNNCPCTESALCYLPMDEAASPIEEALSAFVDHKTKQWRGMEGRTAGNPVLDGETAKHELEAKYPNIYDLLAQRHQQLKLLYANYLKSNAPQQISSTKKVGRNEPCPCGSGKKYKKCCGAGKPF